MGLPLEDRVLLVTAYWQTNLTLRQLAPLFGVSKSAAGRIIGHIDPLLALKPRRRFRKGAVLIGALTRLVVAIDKPLPGNRNDCKAWEESGAKAVVGRTSTIADGGCPGTGPSSVPPAARR